MASKAIIKADDSMLEIGPYENEYIWVKFAGDGVAITSKPYLYTDQQDLLLFFESLSKDWKGWSGERSWISVEGDFEFTAIHDGVGAVKLGFSLNSPPTGEKEWRFSGSVKVELGSIEQLVKDLKTVFNL